MDILNCKTCKHYKTENCKCKLEYEKEGTVFDHTLEVMKNLPEFSSFNLQIAALYHDVGKNERTFKLRDGNKFSFFHHESVGKYITRKRLIELKFDINSINFILNLIEHHMEVHRLKKVTDKAVRKFLRNCSEFMEDLFILVDADSRGTFALNAEHQLVSCSINEDIKIRVREINEELKKISEKPFRYFNGTDLMKYFGIEKPCKKVGELMNIQNEIIDEYGYSLDKEHVLKLIKGRFKP